MSKRAVAGAALLGSVVTTLSTAALPGCGGGSGGSAASVASTRAATVNVYVTDGFADQYSHVLVTLYGIDVSTDNGSTWTTI